MRPVARQRGWALLIVLVALAIVAFLARDALVQYFGSVTGTTAKRELTVPQAAPEADQAAPAPREPIERARSVEPAVRQQAEDLRKHIDEQAR